MWGYKRMFVEQEQGYSKDSHEREFAERKSGDECDEQKKHDEVGGARHPQRAGDAEVTRDGVESGVAVELEILASVEDVEAGNPEGHSGSEKKDPRVERAAYRDPRCGRGDAEGESEHEMRPAGKAFGVGVKKNYGERDRRKPEREAIQLSRRENEDGTGNDYERGHKSRGKLTGGKSAGAGAGIGGIDGGIGETVEGHGRGAGRNHVDNDPQKLMGSGKAGGSKHGAAERERESEDGVLPLDHL